MTPTLKLDNAPVAARIVYRPWVAPIEALEVRSCSWTGECGSEWGVLPENKTWGDTCYTDKNEALAWAALKLSDIAKERERAGAFEALVVTGREGHKLAPRAEGTRAAYFLVEDFEIAEYNGRPRKRATATWAGGVLAKKVLVK